MLAYESLIDDDITYIYSYYDKVLVCWWNIMFCSSTYHTTRLT